MQAKLQYAKRVDTSAGTTLVTPCKVMCTVNMMWNPFDEYVSHTKPLTWFYSLQQNPKMWSSRRFSAYGQMNYKNCMNIMGEEQIDTNQQMLQRLEIIANDKIEATRICKREIESLMEFAADVTQMEFVDKQAPVTRICKTPAQMRWSLIQNPTEKNMKILHWMFHELPWSTHKECTLKGKTHQDLVEERVMDEMNCSFLDDEPTNHKKRNCIQQLYSKLMNNKKQDIMRKGGGNIWEVQAFLKRPIHHDKTMKDKKYSRSKTVFYWSKKNDAGITQQYEVISCLCVIQNQKFRC